MIRSNTSSSDLPRVSCPAIIVTFSPAFSAACCIAWVPALTVSMETLGPGSSRRSRPTLPCCVKVTMNSGAAGGSLPPSPSKRNSNGRSG